MSAGSLIPKNLCGNNQRPRHLVKVGYRGIRVWHLAASALPLKVSKMSIVPWRGFFFPSVINYYVVEKIHRLAEKTEC